MSKVIIEKLSEYQLKQKGVFNWPVWEKEVSRFDWTYEGDEECYILEGEIDVITDEGTFHIEPGDFVTFKSGLDCFWDIKKPLKKHYNFP
jgi:uncharacterized cupin superfamily protein